MFKYLSSLERSGEKAAVTFSPHAHKVLIFFNLTFLYVFLNANKLSLSRNTKFKEFRNLGAKNFGLFLLYSLLEKGSFRCFCSLLDLLFSFTSNRFNPLGKFPPLYL